MATQGLQYDQNQANIDATLTQDQLAARSQVPGAISLGQMNPVTPITLSPTPAPTVNLDGIVTGANASVVANNDYIKQLAESQGAKSQKDTAMQSYIDSLMQVANKPADLAQAQKEAGVQDLQKKLAEYNGLVTTGNAAYTQLVTKEQADLAAQEATAGQRGLTTGLLGGYQGAIQRQALAEKAVKAAEIGMNAALAQATSGNLTAALKMASDSVDAKYSVLENISTIKKTQLEDIYKDLTAEEKKTADALLRKQKLEDEKIAEEKAQQKAISEMVVNALPQGAPQELVDRASQAKTSVEAAKILGKYSGDYLKYEMLKEQIKTEKLQQAKIGVDIQKVKNDIIASNPTVTPGQAGKYAGALSVILGSDKFTKEQKIAVTNAVNNGQDPFTVIKNQAKNIMGQTNATALNKYETSKAQLASVDSALKSYYANGGNTNIFKGNFEKVLNNLGEVKDPKLVETAVQIAASLQIYRNAVSGTAYSVQEGKDIASIFPGINKTEGLNRAIVDGRMKAFDTTIDQEYRNVIGPAYDDIKNVGVINTPANTPNLFAQALGGSTTNISGVNLSSVISGVNTNGTFNFNVPK